MSLYNHLTELNNTSFPATDVIKSLIDILAQELCDSNLRRGSHTFCVFILRSRDLCDHINFLIKKSTIEDGWISYDEYTAMIEPLETLLLSISEDTDTSCVEILTDTVEKVKDSLSSVRSGKAFQSLAQTVTSEDIAHAAKHDDNVSMDNLVRALERRLGATWKAKFQSCQSDELIVIAIKSAILINVLTEVTINTSVARIRERFGSLVVISKAHELIQYVSVNFNQSHLSEMQGKYSNLVLLLSESLGEDLPEDFGMPGSFLELRKLPGKIRPPYYLQTLILVQYCNALINHYRATKPKSSRKPVDDALSATVTALQGAAKLGSQTSSGSTFESFWIHAVQQGHEHLSNCNNHNPVLLQLLQGSPFLTYFHNVAFIGYLQIKFDASQMHIAKENDTKRLQAWKDRMKLLQARDRNERRAQVSIVVKFKDASRRTPSAKFSDLTVSLQYMSVLYMVVCLDFEPIVTVPCAVSSNLRRSQRVASKKKSMERDRLVGNTPQNMGLLQ
ncbi:hypothetical protein DFS33DRAFT_1382656 [Desarmillaria ectypa]|nr:hypothetical protein DFS33DRAFT_1382656 [Desarmillaria ectypa]